MTDQISYELQKRLAKDIADAKTALRRPTQTKEEILAARAALIDAGLGVAKATVIDPPTTPDPDPTPPPPPAPTAKPAAPIGLVVTAGDGQLSMTWSPNGVADQVDTYQLYLDDAPGQVLDTAATSAVLTGLNNGETYQVRVGAHNALGYGPWSAAIPARPVAATPPPPPPDPTPDPDPAPPPSSGLPANLQPYDPDHPIYVPKPATDIPYKDSDAIIGRVVAQHRSLAFDTGAESPPVYIGRSTDPVWTIGSHKVHAPAGLKNTTGSDHPLVIFDMDGNEYGQPVEYRMWQATATASSRTITYSNLSVSPIRNDGGLYNGQRCLGHGEIEGKNPTGSGNSYTAAMNRPHELAAGAFPHAMRTAIGYPRSTEWFWPATKTEQQAYAGPGLDHAPMGARIAFKASARAVVANVHALLDSGALRSNAPALRAAHIFVNQLDDFGMVAFDGTTGNHNTYWEGDDTAGWASLMGPKNSSGSWNDIARAIKAAMDATFDGVTYAGWRALYVIDPSVFNSHGR